MPLAFGPDEPSTTAPSASLTMTFAVMGLGTVFNALTNRRDPASGLAAPVLKATAIGLITVALVVLATRVDFLQQGMLTQPLTGPQWLACLGLALRAADRRRDGQMDPPRPARTRGSHRCPGGRRAAACPYLGVIDMAKDKPTTDQPADEKGRRG